MINPNIFQAMIMDKNRDTMAQPTSLDIWMYLIHITKIVGVQWINLGNSRWCTSWMFVEFLHCFFKYKLVLFLFQNLMFLRFNVRVGKNLFGVGEVTITRTYQNPVMLVKLSINAGYCSFRMIISVSYIKSPTTVAMHLPQYDNFVDIAKLTIVDIARLRICLTIWFIPIDHFQYHYHFQVYRLLIWYPIVNMIINYNKPMIVTKWYDMIIFPQYENQSLVASIRIGFGWSPWQFHVVKSSISQLKFPIFSWFSYTKSMGVPCFSMFFLFPMFFQCFSNVFSNISTLITPFHCWNSQPPAPPRTPWHRHGAQRAGQSKWPRWAGSLGSVNSDGSL